MKLTLAFGILSILSTSLAITCFGNDCGSDTCQGVEFNQFCCVDGYFSGPAQSSIVAVQSSIAAAQSSISASESSVVASENAAESSREASQTQDDANSFWRRAATVTVEMSPGLTCIGASARTITDFYSTSIKDSFSTASSNPITTSSSGVAAMITQRAVLALGGAAAFAYGAM